MLSSVNPLVFVAIAVAVILWRKGYLAIPGQNSNTSGIDDLGKSWVASIKAKIEAEVIDELKKDVEAQLRGKLKSPSGGSEATPPDVASPPKP